MKASELISKGAEERIRWAIDKFQEQALVTTSFGAQSAAFLHLVSKVAPNFPVLFIDTGYHFPETLAFARALTERLNLNLKTYRPLSSPQQIESQ
ncbi:MAG: phosphoadenosine phosphosulfate reductase, partial [Bacteroidetes bacterium]|nr:phosphoadenosine phosphosulfate reductase [Bacteroidota bacterium]